MAQDGLSYFEPAFADELCLILSWAFDHMQAPDGGSVYLRLSTRALEQPRRRLDESQVRGVVEGGYWMRRPTASATLAVAYVGALAPEAQLAVSRLMERNPGLGLLAVTSPDRLHQGWRAAQARRAAGELDARSEIEALLGALAPGAVLVTVIDGHPAALSWFGSVWGHEVRSLGVERFGQSGDIQDVYRLHGLDAEAIAQAASAPRRPPYRPPSGGA